MPARRKPQTETEEPALPSQELIPEAPVAEAKPARRRRKAVTSPPEEAAPPREDATAQTSAVEEPAVEAPVAEAPVPTAAEAPAAEERVRVAAEPVEQASATQRRPEAEEPPAGFEGMALNQR